MPIFSQIQTNFSNGISQNSKNWLPYSARFTRNLAIFEDSDSVTLTPIPVKDSGSVVTDLVKWIVDANPYENARYALGDSGIVYKIASNVWTSDHTIGSGAPTGQGLVMLSDAIYFATSTTIGRKFQLSTGSGTYNDDFFTDGTNNLDANVTASGNTYTLATTIGEASTAKITYAPAFDPLKVVSLYVTAKGTGNWTVTIHDVNNNSLGSVTVANASLTNGQMNTFTFATPIRINIGSTYHIHVTSTVADGTVQTGTSADLSTAQYQTIFGILIADTDYHPMIQHTNGVTGIWVVGNEHYLGTYDNTTYNPNKITFEPGYKVRALMIINEYVAAFCWKTSNIDSFEGGYVYFWDGISNYFNFKMPITLGMPNAASNFKNRLMMISGSNGDISMAPDQTQPFRLLQDAPKLTIGSRVEVLPGAMAVWQNRALWGYSNTNDANAAAYNDGSAGAHADGDTYTPPTGMEQGVYEFGNQSDRAITYTAVSTEVLNFAFQPSTVIANPTAFKIGCIAAFGKDCYVSYKDGTSYYVDRITKGNNPAATGSWESLVFDKSLDGTEQLVQQPQKEKLAHRVRVTFNTLPTGATVTAKYRLNRAAAWTFGTTVTAGGTTAVALIDKRYNEVEYGFDVTATTTNPVITSVGIFYEPLPGETAGSSSNL